MAHKIHFAPNLTKLAKESVVYDNAYSLSSYTAKSVGGFLSSRYPSTMYRDGMFFQKFYAANLFLTEVLQQKAIPTVGWHAHMYFGRGKGLDIELLETEGLDFAEEAVEVWICVVPV